MMKENTVRDKRWRPIVDQATVVQKADSSIHRLTPGPLDRAIGFPNIYLMDRDLSRG